VRSEAKGEARGVGFFGEIMLRALLALSLNLLVVFVQDYAHWSPLVASGRMTFLQAVYVEWVWYYIGHRYGGVLTADFPGSALLVIALVTRMWRRRNRATRAAGASVGEALSTAVDRVWPPPPRDPNGA